MDRSAVIELIVFILLLLVTTPLLGAYLAKVFQGIPVGGCSSIRKLEGVIYRLCHIDQEEEMDWKVYLKALLIFNTLGIAFVFLLQLIQGLLPLNPQGFPQVEWSCALNTAISFVTNTNWQAYAGETTLSYFTQMVGLTVQNFVSAACGNAVLLALIRAIISKNSSSLGNFWVDLVRTVCHVLLPLSIFFSLFLVSQGCIQNTNSYVTATTLEGKQQIIPMGPVASQIAIKQLGTNGGGFFNTNSCHPFENPTPLTNFFETYAILLLPAASVYMFGIMLGSRRQGIFILLTMFFLWALGLGISFYTEQLSNPAFIQSTCLEGKEVRFGVNNSVLWALSTTATSNGSVNAMHSSLSPLTSGIALLNIMIGEVIFGGVGVGLIGMLMFILLTVFLSGLMIGRSPELFGKKIDKQEMRFVMLAILMPCALILIGSAISAVLPIAIQSLSHKGPHGLTEILYAFSSASGNNGSAFAGLNANTTYYNLFLALCMLIARLSILVPGLAIAGSLSSKNSIPPTHATFQTDTALFAALLFSIIFIVAVLTFFPALTLGPILEHILMRQGRVF